jgi:hypothetical protein
MGLTRTEAVGESRRCLPSRVLGAGGGGGIFFLGGGLVDLSGFSEELSPLLCRFSEFTSGTIRLRLRLGIQQQRLGNLLSGWEEDIYSQPRAIRKLQLKEGTEKPPRCRLKHFHELQPAPTDVMHDPSSFSFLHSPAWRNSPKYEVAMRRQAGAARSVSIYE